MPAITVRGVTLLPPRDTAPTNFKILVPVMANDLSNAAAAGAAGDVVELRLDALSILDAPNVQNVLCAARAAIGQGVPLLATIRTKKEGGLADLTDAAYGELGTAICHSGLADLLDVEASTAPAVIAAIQQQARESGVKTVFSSHNFAETPPTETMVNTLTDMVRRGADIAKLAVMPHTPADTARLLEATAQAAQATGNDTPLITMSMGSRICGAAFGSCAGRLCHGRCFQRTGPARRPRPAHGAGRPGCHAGLNRPEKAKSKMQLPVAWQTSPAHPGLPVLRHAAG